MTASLDAPITWLDVEAALLRFDPVTKVVSVFRTKGNLRDRILFQKPAEVILNVETSEERVQRQTMRLQEGLSNLKKLQSHESHAIVAVSTKEVGCFSHWGHSAITEPTSETAAPPVVSADRDGGATGAVPIVKYFLHTHCGTKLKTVIFHSRGSQDERLKCQSVVDEIVRNVYVEGAKRLVAFVSPVSGSGHALKMWQDDVLPILYMSRHQIRVVTTTRQGHLEDSIAEGGVDLYKNDHVVIAVGGDGMVHEAVNGVMRRRDALLASGVDAANIESMLPLVATIPAGSGCALAKCFNILEPAEAARAIVHLNATFVDLLHVAFLPCMHHFVPTDEDIETAKRRKQAVPLERDEMTKHDGPPRYAFLNCAFAITNEIDKGSEKWRWMGNARFTVKAMQLLAKGVPLYRCRVRYIPWTDAVTGEGIAKIYDENKIDTKSYPKCTARDSCAQCLQNRRSSESTTGTQLQQEKTSPSESEWLELPEDRFALLMLMNIVHAARDMAIAPLAHVGDGAIDIVYTGKRPEEGNDLARSDFVKVFLNLESGEHIEVPGIRYVKAREVEVLPQDGLVMADGELLPISGVRVKTVPKAVRIVRSL